MRHSFWLTGLGLLALGACESAPLAEKPAAITPTERFSIEVQPAPLELKLGAHATGLSPPQVEALHDFVVRWNEADRAAITIKAPSHAPDPGAVYHTATGARDFLIAHGVPVEAIKIVGYDGAADGQAPVIVGFLRYEASGPKCGAHWEDLALTFDNREYDDFGCAITANLAAQLADPSDLLHPREMAPPDAARRQQVLDKYRTGTTTSTAKDTQANGAISTTAQ